MRFTVFSLSRWLPPTFDLHHEGLRPTLAKRTPVAVLPPEGILPLVSSVLTLHSGKETPNFIDTLLLGRADLESYFYLASRYQ